MGAIKWKDEYKTGLESLDHQRERYVTMLSELEAAACAGQGQAALGKALRELAGYMGEAMGWEDAMMKEHRVAMAAEHLVEHDDFRRKVAKTLKELQAGKGVMAGEVVSLLKGWLTNHMVRMDGHLSSQLRAKIVPMNSAQTPKAEVEDDTLEITD
jgi:hemerythrin-like metal-binding protein